MRSLKYYRQIIPPGRQAVAAVSSVVRNLVKERLIETALHPPLHLANPWYAHVN